MVGKAVAVFAKLRLALRSILSGPQALAFMPAVALGGYWAGGEGALIFVAILIPIAFAIAGLFSVDGRLRSVPRDRVTNLPFRDFAVDHINQHLAEGPTRSKTTAAIALQVDDFQDLVQRLGTSAGEQVLFSVGERVCAALRDRDALVRLDGENFGIALSAVRRADLETLIQLSTRIQKGLGEPFLVGGLRVYVTTSVGFCTPDRAPSLSGNDMLMAAEWALEDARGHGGGTIRAFAPSMQARARARGELSSELSSALENGEIGAWFQPQVASTTGEITGFEALARWKHPTRGLISPVDFLPLIVEAGLSERLGQVVLYQSLSAIREWDKAGHTVANVGVNFSGDELRNPKLVENLKWELDRFDLMPGRLAVEVLENVIAETGNDIIVRNLWALKELGCPIDLDDFGTGHASIGNIRRFAVDRIKIDRSFVTNVDTDRDQQGMVAAILTLAERLELDTLAEGVETVGEQAMLAQLGCGHIQGYGVAKPMPFEKTVEWMQRYRKKIASSDAPTVSVRLPSK